LAAAVSVVVMLARLSGVIMVEVEPVPCGARSMLARS
jgi:hypothetical protein